uniref:AIG1-type G domain-containing protein n=1 Tax=Lepisosteus oculatus TaxID=7918 RepID=W5LWK3_LEPOC
VSLCPPGPHTLLLVIDLDSNTDWRSVKKHLDFLSERVWRHTIVLFTWGDTMGDTTIEQLIERGGKELQCLVEKCGNRYHVLNDKNRDDRTQVTELLEKIEDMVAGNYGLYFTTDIDQREEDRQRETEELRQREEERQKRKRLEEDWSRREEELKEKMRKTLKEEELEKEMEEEIQIQEEKIRALEEQIAELEERLREERDEGRRRELEEELRRERGERERLQREMEELREE